MKFLKKTLIALPFQLPLYFSAVIGIMSITGYNFYICLFITSILGICYDLAEFFRKSDD